MKRPIRTASTFVLDHDPMCKCGNHATTFLQVHRVDGCDREEWASCFVCAGCLGKLMAQIFRIFERLDRVGPYRCKGCGMELASPSDLIVRVESLTLTS